LHSLLVLEKTSYSLLAARTSKTVFLINEALLIHGTSQGCRVGRRVLYNLEDHFGKAKICEGEVAQEKAEICGATTLG